MPKVTIDGIEYVPRSEVLRISDEKLRQCLIFLTAIRATPNHPTDSGSLHEDWALDALCVLVPELAKMSGKDPAAAHSLVRLERDGTEKMPYGQEVELLARALTKG